MKKSKKAYKKNRYTIKYQTGGKFPDMNKDGDITQADIYLRKKQKGTIKQKGGVKNKMGMGGKKMMYQTGGGFTLPPETITYPDNIPNPPLDLTPAPGKPIGGSSYGGVLFSNPQPIPGSGSMMVGPKFTMDFRPKNRKTEPKPKYLYGGKKMYQYGGSMYDENQIPAGVGSTAMTVYQEGSGDAQRAAEQSLRQQQENIMATSSDLASEIERDREMQDERVQAVADLRKAQIDTGLQGFGKLAGLAGGPPPITGATGAASTAGTEASKNIASSIGAGSGAGQAVSYGAIPTQWGGQGASLGQAFQMGKSAFQAQRAYNAAVASGQIAASPAASATGAGLSAFGKGLGSFAKSGAGLGTIASLAGMGVSKLSDDDDPTRLNFGEGAGATLSGIGAGIGTAAGAAALAGSTLGPIGTLIGGGLGAIYGIGSSLVSRNKARKEEQKLEAERQKRVDEYNEEIGENYASQMARLQAARIGRKTYSGYNLGQNIAAQLGGLRMAMPKY